MPSCCKVSSTIHTCRRVITLIVNTLWPALAWKRDISRQIPINVSPSHLCQSIAALVVVDCYRASTWANKTMGIVFLKILPTLWDMCSHKTALWEMSLFLEWVSLACWYVILRIYHTINVHAWLPVATCSYWELAWASHTYHSGIQSGPSE